MSCLWSPGWNDSIIFRNLSLLLLLLASHPLHYCQESLLLLPRSWNKIRVPQAASTLVVSVSSNQFDIFSRVIHSSMTINRLHWCLSLRSIVQLLYIILNTNFFESNFFFLLLSSSWRWWWLWFFLWTSSWWWWWWTLDTSCAWQEAGTKLPFFGFGGGARLCPGSKLACTEICILLHHRVTKFE